MVLKRIFKFLAGVLSTLFLLLALVLLFPVEPEQIKPERAPSFVFPDSLVNQVEFYSIDSLKSVCGPNKVLPPGYEIQALLALSIYPELKNLSISMIMTESGAPMEATFKILTLFGSAKKRVYEIRLNNAYNTPFDEILLRELPFDAQVGILAHELGHVVYYDRLNALEIGNWGLQYLFNEDFQSIHEKTTDLMPVYYGMGWQVYNYAKYVRESEKTKPLYEAFGSFIDKYYLTQFEIHEFMNEEGIY